MMTHHWLSPRARERLESELADLVSKRDVDPDSGGYVVDAWLTRRSRIREIHELLSAAGSSAPPPDDGVAEPGMVLTVRYGDAEDTETFLLGVRGVEGDELEVYSPNSPLGQALLGATPGEERRYRLPDGRHQKVTLLAARPLAQSPAASWENST